MSDFKQTLLKSIAALAFVLPSCGNNDKGEQQGHPGYEISDESVGTYLFDQKGTTVGIMKYRLIDKTWHICSVDVDIDKDGTLEENFHFDIGDEIPFKSTIREPIFDYGDLLLIPTPPDPSPDLNRNRLSAIPAIGDLYFFSRLPVMPTADSGDE